MSELLPIIVKCIRCKKSIDNARYNQKYCSVKCRTQANSKRWRDENPEYQKEYMKKNIHKKKVYGKKYRSLLKSKFINIYGGICSCCGDNRAEFLTLDHVQNDGYKHRSNNGSGPRTKRSNDKFYLDAINNYQPNMYQVLCMNCNCAKSWYGECPCKNYQR